MLFLLLATKSGVTHPIFFFFSIACSQPYDSEISNFGLSWDHGVAASSKARMYPGLLRTALVGACCPGVIINSAPFQLIRV